MLLTDKELALWTALAAQATDGPWNFGQTGEDANRYLFGNNSLLWGSVTGSPGRKPLNDARFICEAREAVPKLLEAAKRWQTIEGAALAMVGGEGQSPVHARMNVLTEALGLKPTTRRD